MKKEVRFTIGRKILTVFLFVAIAFTGLCGYTFFQLNAIEDGYDSLLSRSTPLVFQVKDLTLELRNQGYYARGYLLTGDKVYVNEYNASEQKMEQVFSDLEKKLITPEGKQKLSELKKALNKYHEAAEKTIQIRTEKGIPESLAYMSAAGATSRDAEQQMNDFVIFLTERMNLRIQQTHETENQIEMTIVILDSIIVVLAVGIALWLSRSIATPINTVLSAANKIADGNLQRHDLHYRGNDEIGDLIKAFNRMEENLREVISQTSEASGQVASSSANFTEGAEQSAQAAVQVAQAITQVSMGAEMQVKAVDEAAAVVEEMSANITQVSANANSVSKGSMKAADMAQKGEQAIAKAVQQMGSAEKTVADSAEVIIELGVRSKEIGQIVETISGIAGQTNLLALNAAIEAARAGEQGRGFAVVADEVRKLAEQSQDAAKRIAEMIAGIQGDTDKAVQVMAKGKLEVETGAVLVQNAGAAFNDIRNSVEAVSDQVGEISGSIQHLANGSKQIIQAVRQIETVSKEAAAQAQSVSAATEEQSASMEEISASSHALRQMADQLRETVSRFKF
ncbi:HAMP domain-containing methyl-accepting chemotaxis protein [Sporomusa sp.]|uniref:HAMP domain-containing methyl-accepting chemotaxis protein n=1 Tax=Sporomusa sp. TaxID=2078658 RepID=UPI002BE20789|nr:methyl-accepting chemotaxis protein [Sporomusa sp.]HWR43243.1 methyl-accepting chemotaxis protein [Sporomusa sp.]